jgi:Fe-S-cluster containining protein
VNEDRSLAQAWLESATSPAIAHALEDIYAQVAREIAARGPACWASGRCCNFDRAGHRLYVTGLEAAYCVARLPAAGLDHHPAEPAIAAGPLTTRALALARERGGCPFQVGNLCGVHAIKPLGCRVYFCDRSAQDLQQDLTERTLARVKSIHETHAIPYRYGEWRSMLDLFVP